MFADWMRNTQVGWGLPRKYTKKVFLHPWQVQSPGFRVSSASSPPCLATLSFRLLSALGRYPPPLEFQTEEGKQRGDFLAKSRKPAHFIKNTSPLLSWYFIPLLGGKSFQSLCCFSPRKLPLEEHCQWCEVRDVNWVPAHSPRKCKWRQRRGGGEGGRRSWGGTCRGEEKNVPRRRKTEERKLTVASRSAATS